MRGCTAPLRLVRIFENIGILWAVAKLSIVLQYRSSGWSTDADQALVMTLVVPFSDAPIQAARREGTNCYRNDWKGPLMTFSPNAINGLRKSSLRITALSRARQPYAGHGLQQLLSCYTVDRIKTCSLMLPYMRSWPPRTNTTSSRTLAAPLLGWSRPT